MSHIVTISAEVRVPEALRSACRWGAGFRAYEQRTPDNYGLDQVLAISPDSAVRTCQVIA